MENKFNVLDPVLVYATIHSIAMCNGKIVYNLKIETEKGEDYIYDMPEDSIQTVF